MARFLNDQAQIAYILESGTYAVTSGDAFSPGLVQDHNILDNTNIIQTRFVGQGNRNVGIFSLGPLDSNGTIRFLPQDWRMLGFALGSIARTSGTAQTDNYRYDMTEVNGGQRGNAFTSGTLNPWISFTIEESRTGATANQNSVRTIKGAVVNEYTLTINQGEPVSAEIGIIAQVGSWFSGAVTSVTIGSNRPYLWSDALFRISPDLAGGAVVTQETLKNFSFRLRNNFESPHYINGSRVIATPYNLNRDYEVNCTADYESTVAGSLYNVLFQGGSRFNCELDINNTYSAGSRRLILTMSGCVMNTMEIPVAIGGISEVNYTFVPGSVSAVAHDRVVRYGLFP